MESPLRSERITHYLTDQIGGSLWTVELAWSGRVTRYLTSLIAPSLRKSATYTVREDHIVDDHILSDSSEPRQLVGLNIATV